MDSTGFEERVVFFSKHAQNKAWVPGVGTHKNAAEGTKVLGKLKLLTKKGAQW